MAKPRILNPTTTVAKRARVGDAIRNPVCLARDAPKAKRDAAYRTADRIDAQLAKRGLKIDNTALCIGYVERE